MILLVAVLAAALGAALGIGWWRRAPSLTTSDFTLYLLGGSTALGDPYAPRADFGRLVSLLLDGRVGDRPLQVVNLGRRGLPAAGAVKEAERIARQGHPPGTAAALLYLGNNEFLGFDRKHDLRGRPRRLFDVPVVTPQEKEEVLRRYERSIDRIVQVLEAAGVPSIASTAAVNLADWEPNRSVLADSSHGPMVEELLQQSAALQRAGDARGALRLQHQILTLEPRFALASKRAGDLCRELGDTEKAAVHYRDAADYDANPYRELSRQDEILRAVCRRHGVPVVEAASLLASASADGLVGYDLMWDNCHPNLSGYVTIAAGFAAALCDRLGLPVPGAPPALSAVEAALGIDTPFQREVLHERGQYCYGAATLTFAPEARLARARLYLERAAALGPEDAGITCSLAVLSALEGNLESSLALWRRAHTLDPQVALERAGNRHVAQIMRRHGVEDLRSRLR